MASSRVSGLTTHCQGWPFFYVQVIVMRWINYSEEAMQYAVTIVYVDGTTVTHDKLIHQHMVKLIDFIFSNDPKIIESVTIHHQPKV